MEKHISKKLVRGIFALSAGFLLASCDPVSAVPSNYANPVVVNDDNTKVDVKDNELLQVYNLVEGEKNSEVVSQILREIAEKKFGKYKDFYEASKDGASEEVKAKYISDHKDFFGEDDNKGKRFDDFVTDINNRISETFYNEITSGSYNDEDGKFSEEKFYNSKLYDLYDLESASDAVKGNKFYITKDEKYTKEKIFGQLKGKYFSEEGKRGYIEEKVYPEILKNKLVESYIYDENPSSLGRAYARKINYVKVSFEDNQASLWKMLKFFSKTYIEEASEKSLKENFELITDAVKGFGAFSDGTSGPMVNKIVGSNKAVCDLLDEAHKGEDLDPDDIFITVPEGGYKYGTNITLVEEGEYYRDTKLGKILESFADAVKAEEDGRFATSTQKAELDKFTGEGKSKEYGLMQKLISLAKEDYTTDGWFLKNGGASELPSAIRDRLFNIKVANILDDNADVIDETTQEVTHSAALPDETKTGKGIGVYNTKNYLRNINDNKLMLSSEASTFENEHYNYIHLDYSGKAFYICEVLEAPSTAKFNKKSELVYKDGKDPDVWKIEQLSRQVAKILGTKDSYIKDAYTEILKDYEFEFFDSSLFEYINNEYPDLELDED